MPMNTADKTTHTIAGHRITLQPGCRYLASRPFHSRERKVYPVGIHVLSEKTSAPWSIAEPVFTVDGLTYDAANELINTFNNGETSFEGRIWN